MELWETRTTLRTDEGPHLPLQPPGEDNILFTLT